MNDNAFTHCELEKEVTDSAEIIGSILEELITSAYSKLIFNVISNAQVKQGNSTKPKQFKCEKCFKLFSQLASAQKHCRNKDKSGTCHICEFKVSDRKNLKRHISNCHGKEKSEKTAKETPRCEECSINFAMKHKHREHMKNKHGIIDWEGGETVKCSECDFENKSESRVKAHFTLHHSDTLKLFSCESCDLVFRSKDGLNKHKKRNHTEVDLNLHSSNSISTLQFNLNPDLQKAVSETNIAGLENNNAGLEDNNAGLENNNGRVDNIDNGQGVSQYGLESQLREQVAHRTVAIETDLTMPASSFSLTDTDLLRIIGPGHSSQVANTEAENWNTSSQPVVSEDVATVWNQYQLASVPNVTVENEVSYWNM